MSRKPPPPPLSASSLGPRSSSLTPSSTRGRRRPTPLNLANHRDTAGIGQDEELSAQLMTDGLRSAISIVSQDSEGADSDISHEIDNLSLLRQDVNANLRQRPIRSSSPSPSSSLAHSYPEVDAPGAEDEDGRYVSAQSLLDADRHSASRLIVDTRPLEAYRSSHLPDCVQLSLSRLDDEHAYTWDSLAEYISPEEGGRRIWDRLKPAAGAPAPQIILVSSSSSSTNEHFRGVMRILDRLIGPHNVKMARGGWEAVLADKAVSATLVSASAPPKSTSTPFPLPITRTHPKHKQSMPSLRTGLKRTNVPSLSIKTGIPNLSGAGAGPSRAPPPPKLALNNLNVDAAPDNNEGQSDQPAGASRLRLRQPSRSNTTGQYPDLHLNIPAPAPSGSVSPGLKSPAAFSGSPTALAPHNPTSSRGMATAPFIVSTIIPSFLYLGPEITSHAEIATLRSMGIKRILNVAMECEDDQALGLSQAFERYTKIPMRDIVEETGVGRHMRQACDLIDDARLHSEPVYVHCKAGKSRSVTVVLAYLIHAHAWTLQTAYAYVAERRKGISPNIGFVAELMQFEDRELGTKKQQQPQEEGEKKKKQQQGGPRDSLPVPSRPPWISAPSSSLDVRPPRPLPPHNQADSSQAAPVKDGEEDGRRRQTTRDEREVMKNGHWVQHRRAPTDRTTLQPGRRASKAGLESLRSPDPETAGGHDKSSDP